MTDDDAGFNFDAIGFVTSDHHFGHVRISELVSRPFGSVDEMNAVMVARWNELVGFDDVVLHLGDLALGPIEQSIALTARLNGRRLLVPGNHDRVSPATQSNRAIERFRPMYEDAGWTVLPEILDGHRHGRRLVASHYPYVGDSTGVERHSSHRPVDNGDPLLHGHTHDRTFGPHGSHEFHVGVDAFNFRPVPFRAIDIWLRDLTNSQRGVELVDGGKLGRSPYHVAERYARGEITREQVIDALIHWKYVPGESKTQGLHDDLLNHVAGSFDDVEAAFFDELIDGAIYTAALNALKAQSAATRLTNGE